MKVRDLKGVEIGIKDDEESERSIKRFNSNLLPICIFVRTSYKEKEETEREMI